MSETNTYIWNIPGCTYDYLAHEYVELHGNTVMLNPVTGSTQITPAYMAHRFDIGWGGGYETINTIQFSFRVLSTSGRVRIYYNQRPSRANMVLSAAVPGTGWTIDSSETLGYSQVYSPVGVYSQGTVTITFTNGWTGDLQFSPCTASNTENKDEEAVIVFDSFKINDVEMLSHDTTIVGANIANSATWTISTNWDAQKRLDVTTVTVIPALVPGTQDRYNYTSATVYNPNGNVTSCTIDRANKTVKFDRTLNGMYVVKLMMTTPENDPYTPPTPTQVVPDVSKPVTYIGKYITGGFYKIFVPTLAELEAFVNYLYSPTFIDAISNLWNSVLSLDDLIVGAKIVPVSPTLATTAVAPKVGWLETTGISMHYTNQQYVVKSLGTINIPAAWNSYLDYAPYTTVTLTLPFIGERQLSTNDVMGKTIGLEYTIDLLSGECVAFVTVDGAVHYQFTGNSAYTIPLSTADTANMLLQPLKSVAGLALAAGGIATGNPGLIAAGAALGTTVGSDAESGEPVVQASLPELTSPTVRKIDNVSGNSGYMGIITPYVCIERTMPDINQGFAHMNGYVSNKYGKIGDFVGFTKIHECHLKNINATTEELSKIEALLKGGVIL